MKICILEDDKAQAERMTQYLDRYRREHADFSYELERYARAFDLLEDYRGDADLLFLDIRLPDQLGIETARRIREKDSRVMIVFVTNLAQYAIEGYSVQVFDYILKPVDYFAFSVKLERALRALSARADGPVLDVKTREGLLRRIPAGAILYIEVQAHDVFLHTGTEVIRQWGTLSRYEELLQGAHFARCSTSCLVNLKYVRAVQKDRVLVGGDSLTVTRGRRKEFLQALAQFRGKVPDNQVDALEKSISTYEDVVHTGSDVLDVVLGEKREQCRRRDIQLTCYADGAGLAFVDSLDLYSLLGDALDNAIRAAGQMPEGRRFITFTARREDGMAAIHIENPTPAEVELTHGLPRDQRDRDYVGFGMRSMQRTAAKYGGSLAVKQKDGIFYLDVLLFDPHGDHRDCAL